MLRGFGLPGGMAAIVSLFAVVLHAAPAGAAYPAPFTLQAPSRPVPDEPFSPMTEAILAGPLHAKWQAAFAAIAADIAAAGECDQHPQTCGAPAAVTRMLAIASTARDRNGLARAGSVNRAVNMAVRPVEDQDQYGVEDFWAAPSTTFTSEAGDCEDYALAKLALLRMAGVAEADLRLVILRNLAASEDHAVAAMHLNGDWYLLDNRYLTLLKDAQLDGYKPLFVLGFDGVRRFTEPPLLAGVEDKIQPVSYAGDEIIRQASAAFLSIPALGDAPRGSRDTTPWSFPPDGTL